MEYITVTFPGRSRDVYIDGEVSGMTGKTLAVEKGTHTIHLGDPRDYVPTRRRPRVQDTNPITPMEVVFEKA